jgi:hypothetical protein
MRTLAKTVVTSMFFEYDGDRVHICGIVELKDGKIKRTYFAESFKAAEW